MKKVKKENERLNKMIDEFMKNISPDDPKYANFFAIKHDCSLN